MSSKSSKKTCVCCRKAANNCKGVYSATSERVLSDLRAYFHDAIIVPGVDVCFDCTYKAKYKRQKIENRYNNNENDINAQLDSLILGN
jgi:hypothetical protein